jgi:hypothetical protein
MNRTRFSSAQMLPPKMAQQYANLAKEGKADQVIAEGPGASYVFRRGSQEIVLVSLDPPQGTVDKVRR